MAKKKTASYYVQKYEESVKDCMGRQGHTAVHAAVSAAIDETSPDFAGHKGYFAILDERGKIIDKYQVVLTTIQSGIKFPQER